MCSLQGSEIGVTTGLVLQELLQSLSGLKAQALIVERFAALPLVHPDRDDPSHFAMPAAEPVSRSVRSMRSLRNCVRHDPTIRTTDKHFVYAA